MTVSAEVYLILEVTRTSRNYMTDKTVATDFTVREMRKGKPKLNPGQVAVKLRLNVDPSLFDEYIPVVEATIHGTDIIAPPEVEVIPAPAEQTD